MSYFYSVLASENFKTKRRFGLTISIILPAILTGLAIMVFYFGLKSKVLGYDPWMAFGKILFSIYSFFYPLYIILICFLIADIEHRSKGFKLIFVLPISKLYLYTSKVLIVFLWSFISFLAAVSIFYLSAFMLNLMYPDFHFEEYNESRHIILYFTKLFISCIGLQAIHLSISHFSRNFIKSVGSGIFLVIVGLIVNNWDKSFIYPYSHSFHYIDEFTKNSADLFTPYLFSSVLYSGIFYLVGFILFTKSK